MNISIKGNIDERIMNLKKITDAQVIVNEYHSKRFNRLEKVLHKTLKKLADVGISGFIDEELLDALDSKLEKEETIKICPECHAYYKGTHTPTDCNYYKGNDSGGSKSVPKSEEAIYKTDKELMEDNPSTEKLPEPKDFYLGEKGFVVLNEKEAEPEKELYELYLKDEENVLYLNYNKTTVHIQIQTIPNHQFLLIFKILYL